MDMADWRQRVTTRFRWAGYPAAALLTLTQGAEAGMLLAGVGFAAAPVAYRLLPSTGRGLEGAITGALAGFAGVPAALSLAVGGALIVALTARDGPWFGAWVAAGTLAGWASARLLSPLPLLAGDVALGALSVAFLCALFAPVAVMAFGVVRRRQHEKRTLGKVAGALAQYLPTPVGVRMFSLQLERVLERRWVTVCFVDLAGFTALVEQVAPEHVVELLDDFSATMADLARAHDAVLDKLLGDGVLLYFEADQAVARVTAARACVALLGELGAAVDALESRWQARGGTEPLRVRCGVASGYCSVGDIGALERRHFTVVGAPVNLASRLQQLARPDGALLDAVTARFAGTERLEPETRTVKGIARPLATFGRTLREPGAARDVGGVS